jgi:hypothetical protein
MVAKSWKAHAPTLLLAMGLVGCGAGGEPLRAQAPVLPGEDERCRAAALREAPIVTEWSAAEKANLQARLRSGALAVEYTGCAMRPIVSCAPRGSYRWQRTTTSTDVIEISNQDELFAKLPLGAFALEGELARSGRIAVQTTVSGQYVLEGSNAAEVPDYGDCAQATHLMIGVSIGSFKLRSGGTLRVGGSAGVGEHAAGATTSSAETILRESGDFESCKNSTDEAVDFGCSAPIQAFLAPLPRFARERGAGTVKVTFASRTAKQFWELRQNQEFVCRTPCTRWVNPAESYQLRSEGGVIQETLDVPDLRAYTGAGAVEVVATPTNQGGFSTGVVLTAVGGGVVFIGGFLALFGGMAERDGLVVGGAVTAGVGAVAVVPGVWLIGTSGPRVDVVSGVPSAPSARGLALQGIF